MTLTDGEAKREVRSFLVARDPSIDRRFRPRPERAVRLFDDIEEDEDDSTSISSTGDDTSSSIMSTTSDGEGALVYLRLRPVDKPSSAYALSESGSVLITRPSNDCTSTSNNKNQMEKHFSFSEIFISEVKQRDIFDKCVGKKIEAEENFTVLTYGTSGSGKTFTLLGDDERPGIIPRSLENIFTLYASNIYPQPLLKIVNAKATVIDDITCTKETLLRKQILGSCADMNFQHDLIQQCIQQEHDFQTLKLDETSVFIWVSFVEIYNELVYDLLQAPTAKSGNSQQASNAGAFSRKNLKIMSNDGKVFIKGLTSVCVKNSLEALKLLRYGLQKVNYASTSINANSSRSHCVFIVDVLKFLASGDVTETTYKFCDLAGSERLDKTGNIGSRLKEAQRINTSLLVLGRCLDAVNAAAIRKNNDVIPFRESKLTMLLQSALLGKEKLTMIVTVTPTDKYYEENLNVLGFSAIAKNIIFKQPIVKRNTSRYSWFLSNAKNQTSNCDELKLLQEENCRLRSKLDRMRQIFEEEYAQREHELWQMFEVEQEMREQRLRNELVDSFQKDHDKNKQRYELMMKEEADNLKRTYESQIELLKKKYEEDIEDEILEINSDDDADGDVDDLTTKRRRTLE